MTERKASEGQKLLDAMAEWMASYLYLTDPMLAKVFALWAIGTWVFDRFYTYPYLAVTANVKGAGKTRVLELLNGVSRNALLTSGPSPAAILRLIRASGGHFTLLWDEAESAAASDKKSFLSEVLNSGYRKGQVIPKALGMDVIKWPSYCPKAFGMIGDPTGTVRDRSIVATMVRGNAAREYVPEVAEREAAALVMQLQAVLGQGSAEVASLPPEHLDTRDREIWGSLFGLASWLRLDEPTMRGLTRWSADNAGDKTAERRRNTSFEDETAVMMDRFAQRAMGDLQGVFREGETGLLSREAVARMHELDGGPWRTFRGSGLTQGMLADLVSRFGVQTKTVRTAGGRKASKTGMGYSRKDVDASGSKR